MTYLHFGYEHLHFKLQEYGNYTLPLAVAIVLSGMYEDDLDNADDVIYTGQGGHDLTGNKRQVRDQVMERGNLALKVCNLSFKCLFINVYMLGWLHFKYVFNFDRSSQPKLI